jgi:hypothetical protein
VATNICTSSVRNIFWSLEFLSGSHIYIYNLRSSLGVADNLNTRSCILTTSSVAAKWRSCVSHYFKVFGHKAIPRTTMDSYINHKSVLFPVDGSICHSHLIVFVSSQQREQRNDPRSPVNLRLLLSMVTGGNTRLSNLVLGISVIMEERHIILFCIFRFRYFIGFSYALTHSVYSSVTSTKSLSFCMTTFSASLTNRTVLPLQSRVRSWYVSRPILAPPPLWLQKRSDLCAHDFAHSPDMWHQHRLANVTCAWSWRLWN